MGERRVWIRTHPLFDAFFVVGAISVIRLFRRIMR